MPRYIDADTWESYFYEHMDDEHMPAAKNALDDMPTADVVEVVRCKECAYKQYYFTNDMVKCGCGNGSHHEDFFCADGERREDGAIQ